MGKKRIGDEPLLMYGEEGEEGEESGRLKGLRNYNSGMAKELYYKKVPIATEADRLSALFREVARQIELIKEIEQKTGKMLSQQVLIAQSCLQSF